MRANISKLLAFLIAIAPPCVAAAQQAATAAAGQAPDVLTFEDSDLDDVTASSLERFKSETSYREYWKIFSITIEGDPDALYTSAARMRPQPSLSYDRAAGIDETDIVKRVGSFLVTVFDGRITSIDTRDGLRLADRVNVYEDEYNEVMYHTLLVHGDHIVVTGYNNDEEAREIAIFRLDRTTGKFSNEGTFLVSEDQSFTTYDIAYAPRIVDDTLVLYSQFSLGASLVDDYPDIRRRPPSNNGDYVPDRPRERRLFRTQDIFRPVLRTWFPALHTISLCPLKNWSKGRMLRCQTSAFVATEGVRLYSANGHVYLWASSERDTVPNCPREQRPARQDVAPSVIYRIEAATGDVSFAKVSGVGLDQYAMHERDGTLFAFAAWPNARCDFDSVTNASGHFALLSIPAHLFSKRPSPIADKHIAVLPSIDIGVGGGKFVGDWLIYTSSDLGYNVPDLDETRSGSVIAVPLGRPNGATHLQVPHGIQIVERVGESALLYGYRDGRGLTVTSLDLTSSPRLTQGLMLVNRFDDRWFRDLPNSVVDAHGGTLIGLPVLRAARDQDSSAIAVISQNKGGQLRLNGEIERPDAERQAEVGGNGYECDIFCEHAFNVRAMFVDNRVIALSGTDMVEAQVVDGKLRELRRLDLTAPLAP